LDSPGTENKATTADQEFSFLSAATMEPEAKGGSVTGSEGKEKLNNASQ
jgi:hypothetical protein